MQKLISKIIVLINLTLFCYQQTAAQCHIDDWTALKALYESTDGENWSINRGWAEVTGSLPSANCDLENLYSVSLDDQGRIYYLGLSNNQLSGSLPTELDNLTNLEILHLNNNQLDGSLPIELGALTNLNVLSLHYNRLSGSLPPELGNLTNLETLGLQNNQLSGSLPVELANLAKLERLDLQNNQLGGSLPAELGNLTNLEYLNISYNQLSGNLPVELGSLSNLKTLYLDNNKTLNGDIPSELGQLTNLTRLDLYNNKFTGQIPITLGNLSNLTLLDLGSNQLSGVIPTELGNLSNLINLSLGLNKLSGNIPAELGNLNNLTRLWLFLNKLRGNIPPELGNLSNLTELRLYINQLSGSIPAELSNLNNLELLLLYSNKLSGNIPPELGNLDNMTALRLDSNELRGTIPSEFGSLNNLMVLTLSENKLNGSIPTELGNLSELVLVSLLKNYFSCLDIKNTFENIAYFFHSPQYYIPENYDALRSNVFDTISVNQNLTLSINFPLANSLELTYQWKRNGKNILGATQSTYIIDDVNTQSVGKYTLCAYSENCLSESFEIISEPIYVIMKGYDLLGQPVQYNQLVVAFDNAEETQKFEDDVLTPNAGIKQKACNCNRELYLWQFPSTEAATKALIEIDQKIQISKTTNKPRGGFNNIINIGKTSNTSIAYKIISDNFNDNYPDSVSIYILDSGLDEQNYNVSSFLNEEASVDICYGIETASGYSFIDTTITITTDYQDDLWHGTFGIRTITENISGNANIELVPLKIFDKSGQGALFDMICALYHAIDHNADVINISAGFSGQPSYELEKAINLARQKDIFIVTAAGNDSLDIDISPQYPAYYASQYYVFEVADIAGNIRLDSVRYDNVISVASIGTNDNLSLFSNYGKQSVTLACYGENIHSNGLGGTDVVASGSSMATYFASKALALEIAKNRQRDYQQVWRDFETDWLVNSANLTNKTRTGKQIDFNFDIASINGCTEVTNCNYFPFATIDDDTCLPTFINLVDSINQSACKQYHANDSIVSNNIINSFKSKIYKAGSFISLENGFEVEVGAEFSAEIELCD